MHCTRSRQRGVPSILDFITICKKRINKLNISINTDKYEVFKDDYIVIAINRTDIKVTKRPMDETSGI
ncbi:MAG TPA: hypothetical protein VN704_09690 [Verrucomicrobiae bacterium]|nr:hypothetical protein [Verrucomicrobiae bacterium]